MRNQITTMTSIEHGIKSIAFVGILSNTYSLWFKIIIELLKDWHNWHEIIMENTKSWFNSINDNTKTWGIE